VVRQELVTVTDNGRKVVRVSRESAAPPDAQAQAHEVATPSANDQAEKVRQELRRLNPDFKGPITYLVIEGQVAHWSIVDGTLPDLSPLLALERLKILRYPAFDPERDASVLRQLTSLEKINEDSAVSYRLAYPANKPATGVSDQWLKAVSKLPVKSRVSAMMEKLQEQNPNFDGKYWFRDNDMYLKFDSRAVTDLSPLKALPELRTLVCSVPFPNRSWLSNLSPLSGMSLTRLECERTRVADLSPLKGMPLTKLDLTSIPASDLTPLKGMPITWFDLAFTRVENLAPLAGMPLTRLDLQAVPVADLSPLKSMLLEKLNIGWSQATDLSPLEGMPLHDLNTAATKVTDLSPLKKMPLEYLWIPNVSAENLQIIRGIESLKTINEKPAAEFWKATQERGQAP
jgi:hypothetical protein